MFGPVIKIAMKGRWAMAEEQTGATGQDPITAAHIDMVVRQMEASAREMVSYIAKLDRFERRMLAHATKAGSRLVATGRRADAVIEALETRQQSLAQLCDQIFDATDLDVGGGALPVRVDLDNQTPNVAAGLDLLAAQIETLAIELQRQREDDGVDLGDFSDSLLRLQAGMDALEQAANAKDAA